MGGGGVKLSAYDMSYSRPGDSAINADRYTRGFDQHMLPSGYRFFSGVPAHSGRTMPALRRAWVPDWPDLPFKKEKVTEHSGERHI